MGSRKDGLRFKTISGGFLLLTLGLVLCSGCTKKKEPPPEGKQKIVVAIRKPTAQTPARKIEPPKHAISEKVRTKNEPPRVGPPEPVPPAHEVPKTLPSKAAASVTQPVKGEPVGPVPERLGSHEGKGLPIREEGSSREAKEAKEPAPLQSMEKRETSPKPGRGFIRVGKGESLSAVAARVDVYGDFLKWPQLYRLNLDHLGTIRTWDDVEKRPLPAGLLLQYENPGNKERHRSGPERKAWVVTVLSLKKPGNLATPTIELIRAGYDAYITRVVVKGKPWLRLRVGFYRDRSGALKAKKKISELLGRDDSWIARADKKEVAEFSVK